MRGVTTPSLSREINQRNWSSREDTVKPEWDEKTLCTFTRGSFRNIIQRV